jgi:pyruvate formate lyase activating enzyme
MYEALFYTKHQKQVVQCDLCPWFCVLKPGQTGNCNVRRNENGVLVTHVFNKVAAFGIDPIEKKPLYHFIPGSQILSVGSVGCNLHCSFCQNHHISQCYVEDFGNFREITAESLTETAKGIKGNIGIAYTYNEPFTFFEFMSETAKLARAKGLKNVVVSNGYINPEPLKKLLPFIDALNIDLKAFDDDFYRKQTKGKLAPVLETLKIISTSKAHLEITNLVIPGLNDNLSEFENMVKWIAGELGNKIPLHLSRYFPQYKLTEAPTPSKTLEDFHRIASKYLLYVYLGNVSNEKYSSTYCPNCGRIVVSRNNYLTIAAGVNSDKTCKYCCALINLVY